MFLYLLIHCLEKGSISPAKSNPEYVSLLIKNEIEKNDESIRTFKALARKDVVSEDDSKYKYTVEGGYNPTIKEDTSSNLKGIIQNTK